MIFNTSCHDDDGFRLNFCFFSFFRIDFCADHFKRVCCSIRLFNSLYELRWNTLSPLEYELISTTCLNNVSDFVLKICMIDRWKAKPEYQITHHPTPIIKMVIFLKSNRIKWNNICNWLKFWIPIWRSKRPEKSENHKECARNWFFFGSIGFYIHNEWFQFGLFLTPVNCINVKVADLVESLSYVKHIKYVKLLQFITIWMRQKLSHG